MNSPALLIDFGSTFTKVLAVEPESGEVLGRAQAPSTVATDVCEGLLAALGRLDRAHHVLPRPPADIDALDGLFIRACSSAAGGLRVVVIGLVPGLTVEAGNAAALGAGAKVVGAFSFKLGEGEIAAVAALRPDMILLTGGTDGGDRATLLHNAGKLAAAPFDIPFVVAGNAEVQEAAAGIIARAGREAVRAGNVMPAAGKLVPASAQAGIRQLFMRRIVDAKGLERIKGRVNVVLPTPMAVQRAARLAAHGLPGAPGLGELMMVDVGGATTDVYSVGHGQARGPDVIPKGLPEPYVKRTVEGDLGVRWNAGTILSRLGADAFDAKYRALFPELLVSRDALLGYVRAVGEHTDRVPAAPWEWAADATLARCAVDLAVERHVGRREIYYAREGQVLLQAGKDLTGVRTLIATGGIFRYNPHVDLILAGGPRELGRQEVLRPVDPRVLLDPDYVLYAVGLLAESHPMAALRVFKEHVRAPSAAPLVAGI